VSDDTVTLAPPRVLGAASSAPPPRTLIDILTATAQAHPDAPAIDDGTTVLTYRELVAAVWRTAAGLAAAGVVRGDRVGIRLPQGCTSCTCRSSAR